MRDKAARGRLDIKSLKEILQNSRLQWLYEWTQTEYEALT
jgi:hypothetical protein